MTVRVYITTDKLWTNYANYKIPRQLKTNSALSLNRKAEGISCSTTDSLGMSPYSNINSHGIASVTYILAAQHFP